MLWSAAKAEPSWAAIVSPSPPRPPTQRRGTVSRQRNRRKRPPHPLRIFRRKMDMGNGDALGFREVKERSLLGMGSSISRVGR